MHFPLSTHDENDENRCLTNTINGSYQFNDIRNMIPEDDIQLASDSDFGSNYRICIYIDRRHLLKCF